MENLIQCENNFFQSINRLEAQMSRLINIVKERNEKTLPNTCSTIPDCPSHIHRNEESWCLGDFDQDPISLHKLKLDQFQTLDKLASFSFNEIELECECDPDPQLYDSIFIFDFMLTLVPFSNLDQFSEPTFIPVSIDLKIEILNWIVSFH